jgi:hypothetical protein
VRVLNSSGKLLNGIMSWSGMVLMYDPTKTSGTQFVSGELIWIQDRKNLTLESGAIYDGQLEGYTVSGVVAPIYTVDGCCACGYTVRDSYSGVTLPSNTTTAILPSGGTFAAFNVVDNLPTYNRWYGTVEDESILFEGTSGGNIQVSGGRRVDIVLRGANGTTQTEHLAGSVAVWVLPDMVSGTSLLTFGPGTFIHPQSISGGLPCDMETVVLTRSRNVRVLSNSGLLSGTPGGRPLNEITTYSGRVVNYDPTKTSGQQFTDGELIWVQERNGETLKSGKIYDGHLEGYSEAVVAPGISGAIAPIYTVSDCCTEVDDDWCADFTASVGMHVCIPTTDEDKNLPWEVDFGETIPRVEMSFSKTESIQSVSKADFAVSGGSGNNNKNDYPLWPNQLLEANVTAAINLTGIAPPEDGDLTLAERRDKYFVDARMIEIMNVGTANLTIKHNSSLSAAENRFSTSDSRDISIAPRDTVAFKYNKEAERWYRLFFKSGSGANIQVQRNGGYTMAGGASPLEVAWDSAIYDNLGMWTSASPKNITIKSAGSYFIYSQVSLDVDGTYGVLLNVKKNGVSILSVETGSQLAVLINPAGGDPGGGAVYFGGRYSGLLTGLAFGDILTIWYTMDWTGYYAYGRAYGVGQAPFMCMLTTRTSDTAGSITTDTAIPQHSVSPLNNVGIDWTDRDVGGAQAIEVISGSIFYGMSTTFDFNNGVGDVLPAVNTEMLLSYQNYTNPGRQLNFYRSPQRPLDTSGFNFIASVLLNKQAT